jgi:dTDP-glucose pyrophosphorylase
MENLSMVMPMAGRGSRFARLGFDQPKPLIPLAGRPFFWWATESLRRAVPLQEMVFVVLQEHIRDFSIDARIYEFYPDAQVVAIPDVTSGAAETAMIGMRALSSHGPVAVNDCDHAFSSPDIPKIVARLGVDLDGALLCFRSQNSAFSYAVCSTQDGRVTSTVEKQVVSPNAIGGCYFVAEPGRFGDLYEQYTRSCSYAEFFMSGVFNVLIEQGGHVGKLDTSHHLSFGTPEELEAVKQHDIEARLGWK